MMTRSSTHRKPVLLALAASFLLTVLIIAGSRNLEHYDSALFGYTIASVVAFGAIVFRYAIWLQRPATRVYWRRGWKLYLQREKFLQNTAVWQARLIVLVMINIAQFWILGCNGRCSSRSELLRTSATRHCFSRVLADYALNYSLVAARLTPEDE